MSVHGSRDTEGDSRCGKSRKLKKFSFSENLKKVGGYYNN